MSCSNLTGRKTLKRPLKRVQYNKSGENFKIYLTLQPSRTSKRSRSDLTGWPLSPTITSPSRSRPYSSRYVPCRHAGHAEVRAGLLSCGPGGLTQPSCSQPNMSSRCPAGMLCMPRSGQCVQRCSGLGRASPPSRHCCTPCCTLHCRPLPTLQQHAYTALPCHALVHLQPRLGCGGAGRYTQHQHAIQPQLVHSLHVGGRAEGNLKHFTPIWGAIRGSRPSSEGRAKRKN